MTAKSDFQDILQKEEWKNVRFDNRFSVSYQLVNGAVLLIQGKGYSGLDAEKESVSFGKSIIEAHIPDNRRYAMVQDWTDYENSSSRARQYFIDSVVRDDRLAGVVFCNISWAQSLSIRMAASLNILKTQVEIAPDIERALGAAMAMLSRGKDRKPPVKSLVRRFRLPGIFRRQSRDEVGDLLEYLESIDWKTGQFNRRYAIDSDHSMLPVFDAISFIKSQLDRTFDERNRIEKDLIRHRDNLEALIRERTSALESREKQLRLLLEHSPISIAVLDDTYHLSFLNRKLTRTFGWTREEVASPAQFAPLVIDESDNLEDAFSKWADALLGEFGSQFGPEEHAIRCKDGSARVVEIAATGIGDRIIILMNDITERKAAEDRLAELAIRDELTGLFNRRHFMAQLTREIERFCRYGLPLSLMLFDVDFFKQVNDTYGHPAGDQVLADLSRLTCRTFRGIDAIFRIGGEEFAVILPETPLADAKTAARRLKTAVAKNLFHVGDKTLSLTISIGIAMVSDRGGQKDELLKHADEALYLAKNRGRNRIETFGDRSTLLDP
ncbi:MAG: diguanylate cyclase [Desulfobacter sp.]|nr:MAG: diguanylate cyclase [Desulfobacter sp.]